MTVHTRLPDDAWASEQAITGIVVLSRIHAAQRMRDEYLADAASRLRTARHNLNHARFQKRNGLIWASNYWRYEARRALRMARHFKNKAEEYELFAG